MKLEKDLSNILGYFGLNLKTENNEVRIMDSNGVEYDIYENLTDPLMIPKKTNNMESIYRFGRCNIGIVPIGNNIHESGIIYEIGMTYHNNELIAFNACKHQKLDYDNSSVMTVEVSFDSDKLYGIRNAFIKEFVNGACKVSYLLDERRDCLSYSTVDNKGKTSESFAIQYIDDKALFVSCINEINSKDVVLEVFEHSQIFQKLLKDYFSILSKQYESLKNNNMSFSIYNNMQNSQDVGRVL